MIYLSVGLWSNFPWYMYCLSLLCWCFKDFWQWKEVFLLESHLDLNNKLPMGEDITWLKPLDSHLWIDWGGGGDKVQGKGRRHLVLCFRYHSPWPNPHAYTGQPTLVVVRPHVVFFHSRITTSHTMQKFEFLRDFVSYFYYCIYFGYFGIHFSICIMRLLKLHGNLSLYQASKPSEDSPRKGMKLVYI